MSVEEVKAKAKYVMTTRPGHTGRLIASLIIMDEVDRLLGALEEGSAMHLSALLSMPQDELKPQIEMIIRIIENLSRQLRELLNVPKKDPCEICAETDCPKHPSKKGEETDDDDIAEFFTKKFNEVLDSIRVSLFDDLPSD